MSLKIELEAAVLFPAVITAGRDYKALAKRILYREEKGDKTLLPIQVKFAKQAMERGLEQPA